MEVHLPCPPLATWLPVRLEGLRVGVWPHRRTPRRVRSTLARWPRIEPGAEAPSPRLAELDALLLGVSLERPMPPVDLTELRPGTLIIELAVPRRRVVRSLLGIERRAQARASAAQSRVLAWLERGCHRLEQWESVDPQGVVVTLARTR